MTERMPQPGDTMPARAVGPVTRTDIVRFAGAGGDFNPLHHDDDVARAAGFDTVIAMGQYQAGLLAAALSDWVGAENVTSYTVRFVRPVRVGDTVQLEGRVVASVHDETAIELSASVDGRPVLTGTAAIRTPREEETA
ncbi:MaoC/PaaZ C-terminal domain-containing protein [Microbacterium aurum]